MLTVYKPKQTRKQPSKVRDSGTYWCGTHHRVCLLLVDNLDTVVGGSAPNVVLRWQHDVISAFSHRRPQWLWSTWRHQSLPNFATVDDAEHDVITHFAHLWSHWSLTTWRHQSLCPRLTSLVTDNMTSAFTFFHSWLHCPLMHATALSTAHQALVSELNGLICFLKMMLKT